MEYSRTPLNISQLRIVLRGISPLIWRRVLVHDTTTLAQLHDIIQIFFAWRHEHLYDFHIYGKDYGTSGADTCGAMLSQFQFRNGERFRYVYDYYAFWVCDIRLEATLPLDPGRIYPVCIGGNNDSPILRHSVATTLLEHGMPLEQIQQFLGHAQLDTTQIYAASTTAMIKDSYQRALAR